MAVWCVRPTVRTSLKEKIAFENGIIFIGWEEIPNLSKIRSKEELFCLYRDYFPRTTRQAVVRSGALWNFSHSIKRNDVVVFSLSDTSKVAIGKVITPYKYITKLGEDFRHIISVRWINTEVSRTAFDKDLQYSFRSLIQVFRVKRVDAEKRVLMTCRFKKAQIK